MNSYDISKIVYWLANGSYQVGRSWWLWSFIIATDKQNDFLSATKEREGESMSERERMSEREIKR